MALLYLALILALVGSLAAVGARQLCATVSRAKANDSKGELQRSARMITAWGIRNGRLPDAGEFAGIFGGAAPQDAWSRPLVYAYDGALSAAGEGGICGRTAASISEGGNEVAFVLLSGGEDGTIGSTPATSGAFSGAVTLARGNLAQVVTLKQLQADAGCFASTQGRLRIANNELPDAARGRNYSATVFGDGGVPPISFSFSGLPAGLIPAGATLSGSTAAPKGSYPVVVTATDSQQPAANSVQRNFVLKVMSSAH